MQMMNKQRHIPRLYIRHGLKQGLLINITGQKYHHIINVLRSKCGDTLLVFNGSDGEWEAYIKSKRPNSLDVECMKQTKQQGKLPNIWLLCAPLRSNRMQYTVEKATELGVARIIPVQTEYTNIKRISNARLYTTAINAVEQCGGLAVPIIDDLVLLDDALNNWPEDRTLYYCDEAMSDSCQIILPKKQSNKTGLLIGPEGGFSILERNMIRNLEFVTPISLGERLLRAETATIVALTILQLIQQNNL